MSKPISVPDESVIEKILVLRGQKVMFDYHLAELYGVETKYLKRAVKRNISRFPKDFMFELNGKEFENLRCQFGTANLKWGKVRFRPYAFTEQGIAMLSSILNSDRAVQVNIHIIRVFTRLRKVMLKDRSILLKLEVLEKKVVQHDSELQNLFTYLREFLGTKTTPVRIGFRRKSEE